MRHQPHGGRILLGLLFDRLVQFVQRFVQPIEHLQQLLPAMTRPGTERQAFQLRPALLREQLLLAAHAFAHGQSVQLVAHGIPHPHQLLPMPH